MTGGVAVLGDYEVVDSSRDNEGLHIRIDRNPEMDKPICFKIEIM